MGGVTIVAAPLTDTVQSAAAVKRLPTTVAVGVSSASGSSRTSSAARAGDDRHIERKSRIGRVIARVFLSLLRAASSAYRQS